MLKHVLDAKEPYIYEDSVNALPRTERKTAEEGGARLTREGGRDLVAESAVLFAALVENSLTIADIAKRLGVTGSRIRQMIAERTLYSFLLNGKRLLPEWQLIANERIPNIGDVNKVIPQSLHPVGVAQWFHQENPELYVGEDPEAIRSPRDWLLEGRDHAKVVFLANSL
ncbi:MAG: hypothetical protein OXG15_08630 [Gammaproteobacteria bacterium]|nr:hypothetical protein [Gammaproteobacteria bacterium]